MLIQSLNTIFVRDLTKLKGEISAYRDEANIWKIEKGINNPAGNLCLHLIGNLNTYIGAILGKTDYVRNRDLEFSLKDVPKQELLQKVEDTITVIRSVFSTLREDQLNEEYPLKVLSEVTSTEFFLIHLAAHLSYHLGQINYHRRLIDQ